MSVKQERGDLEAFCHDVAGVELVPANQREGGATLGSVLNHTYTDGKDNDLIHWLPNQLAHNLDKRSTLMQLEAFIVEYIASNEWRYDPRSVPSQIIDPPHHPQPPLSTSTEN